MFPLGFEVILDFFFSFYYSIFNIATSLAFFKLCLYFCIFCLSTVTVLGL